MEKRVRIKTGGQTRLKIVCYDVTLTITMTTTVTMTTIKTVMMTMTVELRLI